MSYHNYSYYNGPSTNTDLWTGKGVPNPPLDKARNQWPKTGPAFDAGIPPFKPGPGTGYAQSMILPSESHAVEAARPRLECLQGTVTQLFSNFGYINDNIIFSKCDVVGQMVLVGDKVAVDAVYQPNNPTKYKGERVIKIEEPRFKPPPNNNLGKMNTLAQVSVQREESPPRSRSDKYAPLVSASSRLKASLKNRLKFDSSRQPETSISHKTTLRSTEFKKNKAKKQSMESSRSYDHESSSDKYKESRRPEEPKRRPEPPKRKAVSPVVPPKAVVAPPRDPSPSKRRSKSYSKTSSKPVVENFASRELDCAAIKSQYSSLTLPSELFHVSLKFQQSFPLNQPMKLGNSCQFTVLDKRVRPPDSFVYTLLSRELDPADADSTFVAKVMLMSTEELPKLYKETLTLAEELEEAGGGGKLPITKAVKFLVGSLGKDREFGIGGAWSPSEDGPDPETNPRVLINTAIRTVKAATGIDLSGCSSWPKFLELRYYRPLKKLGKKNVSDKEGEVLIDLESTEEYLEPRMETVVYFVPDVWNCMPSTDSWQEQKRQYEEQLARILCPPPAPVIVTPPVVSATATTASTTTNTITTTTSTTANEDKGTEVMDTSEDTNKSNNHNDEESATVVDVAEEEDYNFNETEEEENGGDNKTAKNDTGENQPTHYSKLTVSGMKIVDIKKELELRKLNNRGVMEQLKARLKAALEREEAEEKGKDSAGNVKPVESTTEKSFDSTLSDGQKAEMKRLYALGERPAIIVHQNRRMYKKQMRVRTMSLHSLLSYYDLKLDEPTFELALFAKQFLDMLRRDAVFNIYKSIVVAPETDLASVDESSSKKQKLMVTTSKRTVNRPLLFSCTLIDRERRGRIPVEDLRVLIEGLGICLSTSQLAAVLGKVKDTSRHLMYRQLTDREVTDADMAALLRAGASEDLDYLRELALGNKALFEEEAATGAAADHIVDADEMERLKNELDKSERCRQSLELRVAQIGEEAERGLSQVEGQAAEVARLRGQLTDSKTRLRQEADRADRYRRDLDKLVRHVREMDQMAAGLHGLVSGVLGKLDQAERPFVVPVVTEEVVMDLTEDVEVTPASEAVEEPSFGQEALPVANKNVPEKVVEETPAPTVVPAEDFDLSKPSDYDMIILDETD